jgi:D-alanyl-D-alanine dipeptidase
LVLSIGFHGFVCSQALKVSRKNNTYWQEVQADSLKQMVEIKSLVKGIEYDLRYATKDNFTKKQLYKSGKQSFLRLPAARGLEKVQEELVARGYGLKIFDAYRPYSVTEKMWELIHDERYVANPAKGSGHNRGLSVDLTIIDLENHKALDMGTGFDNFTDSAHHDFKNLPDAVLQNRTLLKETMEKYGFRALDTEWWHYSWPNDRDYQVLDVSFGTLGKKRRKKM